MSEQRADRYHPSPEHLLELRRREEQALIEELHSLFPDVGRMLRVIVDAEKYAQQCGARVEDGWMHPGAIVPFMKRALADSARGSKGAPAPLFFYAPTVARAFHSLLWIREHGEPDAFAELCEILSPPRTAKRKPFSKKVKDRHELQRFNGILLELEALDRATPNLKKAEEIHAAGETGTTPTTADVLAAVRRPRIQSALARLRYQQPSHERRSDLYMVAAYLWHRGYGKSGGYEWWPYRPTLPTRAIAPADVASALKYLKRTDQRVRRDREKPEKTRSVR